MMALVWNDTKSFKQHLEHMRIFRQSHRSNLWGRLAPLKDMPTPCDIHTPSKTGGDRGSISRRGGVALVPIWEIELPRNSKN